MTTINGDPQPQSPGEALFRELLWVHDMLRRDLETVQKLAQQVTDGLEADHIQEQIRDLQTSSPLWKFRANCLYFCRFVHAHHTLEDHAFFPAIRRSNPAMKDVVDILEADHRNIAEYIHEVNDVTRDLLRDDTAGHRQETVNALNRLDEHLLEHLSYEEEVIAPTVRAWEQFPVG
jgi:iron-sulfur cluster repair protein YtfE (RIC family)